MKMKKKIIEYISENGIDSQKVSTDTGVPFGKLSDDSNSDINAQELCELCMYLGIRPEDLYRKRLVKLNDGE